MQANYFKVLKELSRCEEVVTVDMVDLCWRGIVSSFTTSSQSLLCAVLSASIHLHVAEVSISVRQYPYLYPALYGP